MRSHFCNPVDLSYRLQNLSVGPKRFVCREAADPSVILFRDRYLLFASMSGGFWHSVDLVDWEFVPTPTLPNYDYAPDACEVDGAVVVCASLDMLDHPAEFLLEVSKDGTSWSIVADTRDDVVGRTHYYTELRKPGLFRYVRLTGFEQPYGGILAVSGLRVFGGRSGNLPAAVMPKASRLGPMDVRVRWDIAPGAEGYNVRYGLRPDRLYASWLVRDVAELRLSSLNRGQDYWIAVDAFNGSGISRGEPIPAPGRDAGDVGNLVLPDDVAGPASGPVARWVAVPRTDGGRPSWP